MSKREIIRRLRLGDLQKFLRFRYGHTLPDDDAGREDLHELLLSISLGRNGGWEKLKNAIEIWSPWMDSGEAMQLIDRINRTPRYLRLPTARQLGDRLRVTNQERQAVKLKTIKPFDMTDREIADFRKVKDRARKQRQRRAAGRKPRADYLADALTRQEPWKAEGISRRTWERRRAKERVACVSAVKFTYYPGHTCDTEELAASETATDKKRKQGRKYDGQEPSARPRASRTHLRHLNRDTTNLKSAGEIFARKRKPMEA